MATLKVLPIQLRGEYSKHTGKQADEGANQTFQVGNLIYPGGANGVYIATPAGATAATAKNRIAMSAGQNKAAPTRRVEFEDPNWAGEIAISAGGAASTAALLAPGAQYGYAIDAGTGLGYLNLADTTNKVFEILDARPIAGVVGDTFVRVVAKIIPAAR